MVGEISLPKKADNLEEAFRNFKAEPLMSKEEFKQFYVERPHSAYSPILEIFNALRISDAPAKFLFLGFRGSGKSTELYKLKAKLEDDGGFIPIMFSVKNDLDLNDFDVKDFLVFLGVKIYESAREREIHIGKDIREELESFLAEIVQESEVSSHASLGTGIDIFSLIKSKIGIEAKTREIIRKNIENKISDLLFRINNMLIEIQEKSRKDLVIIVDDLDKLTRREQAEKFFFGNYNLLTQIYAHVIYTVPISLAYSPEYQSFRGAFTDEFRIRQIPPITKDGKIWEEGFNFYKAVTEKRMSLDLITEDALKKAILSTGKLSEFIQIMRSSCIYAITRDSERIEVEDVHKALEKLRDSYDRTLTTKHLEILKNVYEKKEARERDTSDSIIRDLIFSLMIVEYGIGDERWEDVNPLLVPLLKKGE